jgi:hypothetical protein
MSACTRAAHVEAADFGRLCLAPTPAPASDLPPILIERNRFAVGVPVPRAACSRTTWIARPQRGLLSALVTQRRQRSTHHVVNQ